MHKKGTFWEEVLQIFFKKTYFFLLNTFYIFTLKMETSWAKKFLKPILQTWNTNDVIVYVWFVYSRIEKKEKYAT